MSEPAEPEPPPARTGGAGLRLALLRAMAVAIIGVLVMWLIPWPFTFALQATSEGISFTTASPVDLVARRFEVGTVGDSEEPHIALDPAVVFVRLDTVYVDFGAPRQLATDDSLVVNGMQHLELAPGCRVQLDPLRDDAVRISVTDDPFRATGAPCTLRARFWTTDSAGLVGPTSYLAEATPTLADPATVELWPETPLEFRGVTVSDVGFASRERSSTLRSALVDGALRFPRLGNRIEALYPHDTLRMRDVAGVLDLTMGPRITALVRGTARRAYVNGRRVSPTLLETAYFHPVISRLVAMLVGILIVVDAARNTLKR